MSIEFVVSDVIPASPDVVYAAWLDSEEYTRMTGSHSGEYRFDSVAHPGWFGSE